MKHPPLKKTTIIATLGPASSSRRTIEELICAGTDVFRLNFSHGTREHHAEAVTAVRTAAVRTGRRVALLADLQGPKIRTGPTSGNEPVTLVKGQEVLLTAGSGLSDQTHIQVSYRPIARDVKVGDRILINDGTIGLTVLRTDPAAGRVICRILNTGVYSSNKGVNFPGTALSVPALTPKDRADLAFILSQDINYVALSFVRKPADLRTLNRLIRGSGKAVKVIAKIEKPEALEHFGDILDVCDGIMVARGDLGVETSPYRVPLLQKEFVADANCRGKLVIVATQMLESMIAQPLPTRAEATDVANAIIDGTDAVMLSGETAVGAYPVEAVTTMAAIARATEESPYYPRAFIDLSLRKRYPPHAICEAAGWAARDLDNAPVVVFTVSGDTALYLAKIRNQSPIYAFTPDPRVTDLLAMAWNTVSFLLPFRKTVPLLIREAATCLIQRGLVTRGALLVIVCGTLPDRGATNMLQIVRAGEA